MKIGGFFYCRLFCLYRLFYNKTKNLFYYSLGTDTRLDSAINVNPATWAIGDEVHAWLFFVSPDKSKIPRWRGRLVRDMIKYSHTVYTGKYFLQADN